jgi:transposase-like protein
MTPPNQQSVAQVSRDTGIAIPTLYKWKKSFSNIGPAMPNNSIPAHRWDAKAKLDVITAVATMNEIQRSEYCRQHGIFPEQIDQWREQFIESFSSGSKEQSQPKETAVNRKKINQLECEIKRKDKALAEAAVLLMLSKKAQAIWGNNEEN